MNKKRYWLRGGSVVLILYALSTAILYPFGIAGSTAGCSVVCFPYWVMPTLIIDYILSYPLDLILPNVHVPEYMLFIGPILFYFVLGAVIGWIYGKFTNKNV